MGAKFYIKNAANVSRRGGINLNICNTLQRFQNHKVKLKHRYIKIKHLIINNIKLMNYMELCSGLSDRKHTT